MTNHTRRPPFIIAGASVRETRHHYPNSEEYTGYTRAIGRAAGLHKIGVNLVRLPPGERSSWPHAEEKEEEFVYVLEGEVDAWIDGSLHRMRPGELAAFPAGTGICHCFINNCEHEALLLVGGEASRWDNRIYYPLHPQRRGDMPWNSWWEDVPKRRLGAHDGMPDALRRRLGAGSTRQRSQRRK
ncbi:MAG TPA: cupin domain-containing protein [Candidatus Binataceae bacterium]|nr:cupin domain-containing protein [Candidatus Binataceae bacterium]